MPDFPEKPRVVILQDDPSTMVMFRDAAEFLGVEIYKEASNPDEAEQLIKELKQINDESKLEKFVLLLDMNLTRGDVSGNDGRRYLQEFEKLIPGLAVILISVNSYPDVKNAIPMSPSSSITVYKKVIELFS